MAMKLKAKGKWKKISSDSLKGFSDFISMEVLTDYELIGPDGLSSTATTNADTLSVKPITNEKNRTDGEGEKQKKKKRKKTKKLAKKESPVVTYQNKNTLECGNDAEEQIEVEGESTLVHCDTIESADTIKHLTTNHDTDDFRKKKTKRKPDLFSSNEPPNKKQRLDVADESSPKKKKKRAEEKETSSSNYHSTESDETTSGAKPLIDMSGWNGLSVPDQVLKNLAELGFLSPTLVQRRILPVAAHGKSDVIAAAETGSGKTLAFGIPLINLILQAHEKDEKKANDLNQMDEDVSGVDHDDKENKRKTKTYCLNGKEADEEDVSGSEKESRPVDASACGDVIRGNGRMLFALVLTPTRELAFQIRDHLRSIAKDTGIKCHVVVGGMSIQKQSRILDKDHPEIVVATPGRLWDIYKQGNKHLSTMNFIRCLVIDEADRMVEKFHFEHLSFILSEVNQKNSSRDYRQTFILSATLTYVPPKPQRLKHSKKKFEDLTTDEKLESLCSQIGIRGKPKVIDLTPKQRTASKLTETRLIFNAVEDKDLNLFCFLKEHSGRTIVFANSIDCIWRLMRLFTLLEMSPLRLFADMQQKQRLQSLEKFKANPRGLLLATDVAARGLDIPGIEHVIHYEVPKTTESYIHRSGRTARANSEGFSIMFVGPKEINVYRKIMKALERDDLPSFPMNESLLRAARERVTLARKIELQEYNLKKQQNDRTDQLSKDAELDDIETKSSMTKKQRCRLELLAKEAGIEDLDDLEESENSSRKKSKKKKLQQLAKSVGISLKGKQSCEEEFQVANERRSLKWSKKQLKILLSQSLISNFGQSKYPTKSGQMIWPCTLESSDVDPIAKLKKNLTNKKSKRLQKKNMN